MSLSYSVPCLAFLGPKAKFNVKKLLNVKFIIKIILMDKILNNKKYNIYFYKFIYIALKLVIETY